MATNSTTENRATDQHARKLSTYDLVIGILAIFSLVILIVPLLVQLPPSTVDLLDFVENALCVVFFADFLRSLRRAPNKWAYFLKGGGWLDLLGSLPFYKLAIFRFARLFRIARVMRTLKGNDYRKMLTERLAQSTLLFTLVIALILVFTISLFVLKAEQGNPHATITTYPIAVWWAFVTITTVGYGDYTPVTALGRIGHSFSCLLALASLVFCPAISRLRLSRCREGEKRIQPEEMRKAKTMTRKRNIREMMKTKRAI